MSPTPPPPPKTPGTPGTVLTAPFATAPSTPALETAPISPKEAPLSPTTAAAAPAAPASSKYVTATSEAPPVRPTAAPVVQTVNETRRSSTASGRRRSSLAESFFNARPPPGVLADIGHNIARGPTLEDLRKQSIDSWRSRRSSAASSGRRGSSVSFGRRGTGGMTPGEVGATLSPAPIAERRSEDTRGSERPKTASLDAVATTDGADSAVGVEREVTGKGKGKASEHEDDEDHSGPGWWGVVKHGLLAFWGYFTTPLGFLVTIYMLNVVAWGGMLFLLLVGAAPAMCHPTCNDDYSGKNIWIEIDSQILNALFCVTGFGLVPWRFRDLYYLLKWRLSKNHNAYLKLCEIHSGWFRSAERDAELKAEEGEAAANGEEKRADTVTGERAPPTQNWKLDYVIWLYCWNTFFQCGLSGVMWGMNRFERPPWSTGLLVGLACLVAGLAGGQVWWEGRKVKKIEGKKKDAEKEEEEGENRPEPVEQVLEGGDQERGRKM